MGFFLFLLFIYLFILFLQIYEVDLKFYVLIFDFESFVRQIWGWALGKTRDIIHNTGLDIWAGTGGVG